MGGFIGWKRAQPGRYYHVTWSDFCAKGHFTAKLLKLNWDHSEPAKLMSADFANGVSILGEFWHCTIEEVARG